MSTADTGPRWRHELKLWLDARQTALLLPQLRRMLRPDPHGEDGRYRVTSLYLDSADLRCYRQTRDGLANRIKYRVRYYGARAERLVLEAKEKRGALVRKHRGPLAVEDLPQLLALVASGSAKIPPVFARGCAGGLLPKVWVGYTRTALVEPVQGLRVTIDEDLGATAACGTALPGRLAPLQLSRWRDARILELKYERWLPAWLVETLRCVALAPEPISKYELGLGRIYLNRTDVTAWTH